MLRSGIRYRAVLAAAAMTVFSARAQESAEGSIRIKTDVQGAQIFIDGREVGLTPLTVRALAPGRHTLTLKKERFADHIQEVDVQAGRSTSVFVVMKQTQEWLPELPRKFKAYHQHRAGYCIGQLTVTEKALEFAPEQGPDKFAIPIELMRSVARSFGPVVGVTVIGIDGAARVMPCRVETADRPYGFWAYRETISEDIRVTGEETTALYDLVYNLWTSRIKKAP